MYPYVPTICTHIYIYLQYVPIFMYNMYSYLYTIFSHIYHIYIQYVPTYIYLQYVPISIYTTRNMYHHIKVLVLISTKYNEVEVQETLLILIFLFGINLKNWLLSTLMVKSQKIRTSIIK